MRIGGCLWIGMFLLALNGGCSKGPPPLVRDPVKKVTGTILIDGKPEMGVAIRLVPANGPNASLGTAKELTPSAMTDADGKFSIGTYDKGPGADGAPQGSYVMTVQWGAFNLMGGQYSGDKFKGKYMDPAKSEIKVTVADAPVDLGEIQLSTK